MEETMRYFTYGGKSYYFDVSEVGCLTRLTAWRRSVQSAAEAKRNPHMP